MNPERERSRAEIAQKWASIAMSLAVVFVVGWMTLETPSRPPKAKDDAGPPASSSAHGVEHPARASTPVEAGVVEELDAGLFMPTLSLGDAAIMPTSAPKHVKIGVVLVTFQGAEGAPPNARNKREALTIAERLAQDARSDFHHAVSGGDSGSADDIGRLPRGVLDPRTEATVFALGTGEISDVLETPRGYWIVRRIE